MQLEITNWNELSDSQRDDFLRRPRVSQDPNIREQAATIVEQVRARADTALFELTQALDGVRVQQLRVSDVDVATATSELTEDQLKAIDTAIDNVRRFHEEQLPRPISVETMPGVRCERVSQPLDSVGLYVPAGTAPLPSAAVMLAVPAAIAGCQRVVLCTPPRADGRSDSAVLVAASRAGVKEIYTVGGAQAIAAMAYGTQSIAKVRKILGPGNAWVTAAKSIVSADPDGAAIDMPAGPSEVLVIADASADAKHVASDLLSQAEHGVDSQVMLLTDDLNLALSVQQESSRQLKSLSRAEIASAALMNSRIAVVPDIDTAILVSNRYAPEHLILQIENPRASVAAIRNAGSVFVGPWTPESVGDYCSGTNHVLPTYGYANSYSGLGVEQYMRYMTVQEVTKAGLQALAPTVMTLAQLEGLDAHAAAVRYRLGSDA